MQINTSIPAEIQKIPHSSFNEQAINEYVTHCKLKVFYIGETGDKRLFTEDFSNKLIKTLPQTPVVAHYSKEDDDFKAHHAEQSVYGYVPETSEIEFKEEDGNTWAFTDIVLFTGREDNIGEVANKIIGKQQSLELDPNTVDYKLHKDGKGRIEKIEFLDGSLSGISVVGDSETPAFTGSEFFSNKDDEFKEMFKNFTSKIDDMFKNSGTNGGVEMNFLENFSKELTPKIHKYLTETYDELQSEVIESLYSVNENAMPVQIGPDFVVYLDFGDYGFYRVNYTRSEGEETNTIEFDSPEAVKARYLTDSEIEAADSVRNQGEPDPNMSTDPKDVDKTELEITSGADDNDKTTLTESELEQIEEDRQKLEEYKAKIEELTSNIEEKDEILDKYKLEEKKELLEESKDLVSEEDFKSIEENLADYTTEDLEVKLDVAIAKKVRAERKKETNDNFTPRNFTGNKNNKKEDLDKFDSFVDKFKDKE